MKRIAILVPVLALALPLFAAGQEAAPALQENPRAARYRDVERGLFVGFEAGYSGLLKTPVDDRARYAYAGSSGGASRGFLIGAELGYDLTSRLSLALFAQGSNQRASASYGAFSLNAGGLDVRYAYYGARDRNDWERFFLYVHGRGGYAVSYPRGLFGKTDLVFQAGPGLEYFTHLRHFAVGFALDYVYVAKAHASGYAAYPTVRYTF